MQAELQLRMEMDTAGQPIILAAALPRPHLLRIDWWAIYGNTVRHLA
jgi:hypothetical protein